MTGGVSDRGRISYIETDWLDRTSSLIGLPSPDVPTMRARSRSLTWRGQTFRFQYLPSSLSSTAFSKSDTSLWAVSRGGEFIGTMPCPPEVTTKDFDVRSFHWLAELLGNTRRA